MALPDSNYKNLAAAVIPNPGLTTDTSITISATNGATFPSAPFYATIMPTDGVANSTNSEIVKVTASSTSGANTTFTVTRAQRDTSAISWNANEAVIAHAVYTEDITPLQDAAFIDDTIGTQTNDAYVGTNNIQDGAVTDEKLSQTAVYSVESNADATAFKFSTGLLIVQGKKSLTTGTNAISAGYNKYYVFASISSPVRFVDTNYTVVASATTGSGSIANAPEANSAPGTVSSFSIGLTSTQSNYARDVSFIAIGRWK